MLRYCRQAPIGIQPKRDTPVLESVLLNKAFDVEDFLGFTRAGV